MLAVSVFINTGNGLEIHPMSGTYNQVAFTARLNDIVNLDGFVRFEVTISS